MLPERRCIASREIVRVRAPSLIESVAACALTTGRDLRSHVSDRLCPWRSTLMPGTPFGGALRIHKVPAERTATATSAPVRTALGVRRNTAIALAAGDDGVGGSAKSGAELEWRSAANNPASNGNSMKQNSPLSCAPSQKKKPAFAGSYLRG